MKKKIGWKVFEKSPVKNNCTMLKITALIKKQSENNVLRWKRKTLIITNYIVEQVKAFLHQNL